MRCWWLVFVLLAAPLAAHAQVEYLATYEGTGTDANPFRADSRIRGTECSSLRSNETLVAGLAYCVGPSLPVRSGVIDLGNKRPIVKADRDKIFADTGIRVTAATIEGLLSELVDSQGVSLKRKHGRERLVVKGREIWSRPAPLSSYLRDAWKSVQSMFAQESAWAATSWTENWNCPDDATSTFDCNHVWVRTGGTTLQIVSNRFDVTASVGTQEAYSETLLDTDDLYASVSLPVLTLGTATEIAGAVTMRTSTGASPTYVYCKLREAGGSDEVEYGHKVAGTLTVGGTVSTTAAAGDVIAGRIIDDQLRCYQNGLLKTGPDTDNSGAGTNRVGLRSVGSGTATTTQIAFDNYSAADARVRHIGVLGQP